MGEGKIIASEPESNTPVKRKSIRMVPVVQAGVYGIDKMAETGLKNHD
jgi:hypothetical protein